MQFKMHLWITVYLNYAAYSHDQKGRNSHRSEIATIDISPFMFVTVETNKQYKYTFALIGLQILTKEHLKQGLPT